MKLPTKLSALAISSLLFLTSCQLFSDFADPLAENKYSGSPLSVISQEIPGANANLIAYFNNDSVFRLDLLKTIQANLGGEAAKALSLSQIRQFYLIENNQEDREKGKESIYLLIYQDQAQAKAAASAVRAFLSGPAYQIGQVDAELRIQVASNPALAPDPALLKGLLSDSDLLKNQLFFYNQPTLFSAISRQKPKDLTNIFWNYLQKSHPDFKSSSYNADLADFEKIRPALEVNKLEKLVVQRLPDSKLVITLMVALDDYDPKKLAESQQFITFASDALQRMKSKKQGADLHLKFESTVVNISFIIPEFALGL